MRKTHTSLALAALLLATGAAQAQTATTLTPSQQYAAESKQLQVRYQADLSICNSESESAGRLQCKRDAKTEYDKSLAAAKAKMTAATAPASKSTASTAKQAVCADCGKVTAIDQVEREGEGSAVGMIAGGVVGGLLGNQVGGGRGKDLATIAGAAGGAYAGREVEKRVNTRKVWVVRVGYPSGETATYEFTQDPGLRVGDNVKKSDKTIVRM